MEFWDVYDKARRLKGYKIMRGGDRRLGKDEYHLTCHICVFSSDGRMLIQKRADFKGLWGGLWDITAGGSVLAGESSQAGASRELSEEVGVAYDFSSCAPMMTFYHRDCISDYFFATADVDPSALRLQGSEVSTVRYATREEMLEMLNSGKFVPYKPSFINLIFDMHLGKTKDLFD